MPRNEMGLDFTAAGEQSVRAFDDAVAAYAGFRRDIGPKLKAVFAADPDMPMAHVLRGIFFQFMALPALLPKARDALAAARAASRKRGANPREELHMAGLEAWTRGDLHAAIVTYEEILRGEPRDFLALKLANFFYFYVGDSPAIRDSVARVLPHWLAHHRGYGFVLGLLAFGLEENGQYEDAERLGRQAVEINPADAWAIHAVAHVHEMLDRHEAGIAWLGGLEVHWSALNNFRYHLWWHRALQHLNRGETDEALRLYDERLWDPGSDEYLDLANDISLLQRLELHGIGVGERWQPVADKVAGLCGARCFAFIDAHYVLALAAAGRSAAARALVDDIQEHGRTSRETAAQVSERVNGALCEALLAYRDGDPDRTVELLAPVRNAVSALGGSHAQRDLFDIILVDAAQRAGRDDYARSLLVERRGQRPGNPWNSQRLERDAIGRG